MGVGSELDNKDACYVCGEESVRTFRDREGFAHIVCSDCRLVRLHPGHLASENLYTDEYFNGQLFRKTNGRIGYRPPPAAITPDHRDAHYAGYTEEILHHLDGPRRRPLRVLDVGCGYGRFLRTLCQRFGSDVEVHGVDLDPEVCAKASANLEGGRVYCLDLKREADRLPNAYFDAITLLDVIEHLDDPRAYLRHVRLSLAPAGCLLLSTPNIESLNARIYKDRWVLHAAPYHTYYFGPTSIRLLLRECGWDVVKLYTERTLFHNERFGHETWRGRVIRGLFDNWLWNTIGNRMLLAGSIMTIIGRRG